MWHAWAFLSQYLGFMLHARIFVTLLLHSMPYTMRNWLLPSAYLIIFWIMLLPAKSLCCTNTNQSEFHIILEFCDFWILFFVFYYLACLHLLLQCWSVLLLGSTCSQVQSVAFAVKGASIVSCASNLLKVVRFCSMPIIAIIVRNNTFCCFCSCKWRIGMGLHHRVLPLYAGWWWPKFSGAYSKN